MWRKSLIYWGIIFVLIGIFLQYQYAYFFFYQEQQQLFLLTEQYARDTIFVPGGTASYIAGFLQQFYLLTGGGAFLTSMLLVGIGWIGGNLLSHFLITCHRTFDITHIVVLSFGGNYRSIDVSDRLANLFEIFFYTISLVIGCFPFINTLFVGRFCLFFVCVRFSGLRVGFKYKVSKVLSSDYDYISGKLFGLGNNFFTYALGW